MKRPGLIFDPIHFISNGASTVKPIVAVRYTYLTKMITRMMTSKSSTMISSLELGRSVETPRINIRPIHFISNGASTVKPIVAVRYTYLSKTITRMMTSKSPIMTSSFGLGQSDETPK